jgi:CRISPR-associated protein Cmr1
MRYIDPVIPAIPGLSLAPRGRGYPDLHTWEEWIRAITPIFGGGVATRETDPVTLIRPSTIRGHLRFWWRATQGAQFSSAQKLRQEEEKIWGSVDVPSQVIVEVTDIRPGRSEACAVIPPDRGFPRFAPGYPAYALFPFQGSRRDGVAPAVAQRDVEFRLAVRYPEKHRNSVFAALWAWMNFGAIGARTRRGCGALECDFWAPKSAATLEKWWKAGKTWLATPPTGNHREWARMVRAPLVAQKVLPPQAAWDEVIKLLREFRQGENVGRNKGTTPNRPGRSRWPEADSLRSITGNGDPRHLPVSTSKIIAFPRAALGLPIIFHFKDPLDSPNNCELYPEQSGRMASPVILRPLGIAGGAQSFPMILALDVEGPKNLELSFETWRGEAPSIGPSGIQGRHLTTYSASPMARRSESGSALEAFLAFAREKGFREVG